MKITFLTLFPELYDSFKTTSIINKAVKKEIVKLETKNIRDYSEDKKELMTLVTALITKKYGHWNDNKIFQREPQKLPYLIRMKLIEFLIEPYDISKETEESLKEKVKHTAETIKKNAN